tara:strand:- start:2685 stop:3662 length:978 start_codon:yes stop_codon:yes gene_type:complete
MAIINPKSYSDQRFIFHPYDNDEDDKSIYSASGILVAGASVSTGALVLNGTDQYLTYPDVSHNSLYSANQISIGCWFNVDTLDATLQALVSKFDFGDNNRSFVLNIDATTDLLNITISSDGTGGTVISATDTTAISTGTDYFVVAIWDGSYIRLYKDGIEVASTVFSAGIFDGDELIAIGADFNTTAFGFFDGTIYQAFILGTALSSPQIENLYHLGKDYRINPEPKQVLLHENFSSGKIPNDWLVDSTGTFASEFDGSTGKYYAACLTGTDVTLSIPIDDWSSADFTDTNTIIAGTPTVARNSSDVTITMSAGDDITDVVVRRN